MTVTNLFPDPCPRCQRRHHHTHPCRGPVRMPAYVREAAREAARRARELHRGERS